MKTTLTITLPVTFKVTIEDDKPIHTPGSLHQIRVDDFDVNYQASIFRQGVSLQVGSVKPKVSQVRRILRSELKRRGRFKR